jgi:type 1 fimbriae regulatory protein FimB
MRRLTENEVEGLVKLAMKDSLRDAVMIVMQFFHGMRSSEVCDLRIADINLETSSIVVRRLKGSLTTTQALHVHKGKPHLDEVKLLRRWIAEKPAGEYLFPTQKAAAMNPRSWWRLFNGYCRAAGVDSKLSKPHSLKHASGTYLLRQGADLATVRQHLGHKSYQSTFRYLGVDDDQASATAQKLFARM